MHLTNYYIDFNIKIIKIFAGKDKLEKPVKKYDFRLLSEDKKKVLVEKGSYKKVMKIFRQIEFFKQNKQT